jgi:hypothetical protein
MQIVENCKASSRQADAVLYTDGRSRWLNFCDRTDIGRNTFTD